MDSKRGPKNARDSNRPHLSILSNMDSKRGPTQQGATRPCQRVANPVETDKHSSKFIVAEPAHSSMKAKRGSTPKVVANPVKKERDSSKLIAAEPAQRGVDAGGVDAAMSDPLAVYLDKSNALLQANVLTPLEAVCKSVCVIRGAVSAAPQAMGKYQADLEQKLEKLADDIEVMRGKAKSIKGRQAVQARQLMKKLAKKNRNAAQTAAKRPKSVARQTAGKRKAASLKSWHARFRQARQALQDEGYTGSLKLKKGMPLYEKMQQMQRAGSANGSG